VIGMQRIRPARTLAPTICVVAAAVAVLTGCGSSSSTSSQSASGPVSSGSASTSAASPSSGSVTPEPTVSSLTGCESKPVQHEKIGLLVPLTGPASGDAKDVIDGAGLAIDQLNTAGGVCGTSNRYTFTTTVGDTQNELASAVASAVQLLTTTANLNFVMTGYASTSNFEIVALARDKMPYLLSGSPTQTAAIIGKNPGDYPTIWSRVSDYNEYNTELPRLLNEWGRDGKLNVGTKTVYMISADDPFDSGIATGLKSNFAANGWKVVGSQTVPLGTVTDWHTTLAHIGAAQPTIVTLLDYTPSVEAAFQNQFMQSPTHSLVFMQYGPSQPQFEQLAKSNANGVIYNLIGGADPAGADTKAISAGFAAKYGRTGGYYSVIAYNEVMLYAYCVKQVGDPANRLAIGQCIGSLKIQTPAGVLVFNPKTHLALSGPNYESIQFFQIQHGKQAVIYPQSAGAATVAPPPWFSK
jgi:branched-chain amino acid transport system substrate-binding protein